jgi:glycosyltransferase involved in cell wall biosynthesis
MTVKEPLISIVTPSYNMLQYLPLCCASVADQGVPYEHIVMDGNSADGTKEWLASQHNVKGISQRDEGMYDALNKAISISTGQIVGHLNCDEQYLPGVLKIVLEYFENHPDVDFIAGNFLVVDPEGELIAYRKSFTPRWQYFFSNYLYTTTCTLFYRRKVVESCRFDISYKSIADVIFVYQVLKKKFKGAHVPIYFSTFTFSGENLSLNPISDQEKKKFNKTLPVFYRILKPLFFVLFFAEKIIHGTYWEKKILSYSIFRRNSGNRREIVSIHNPTYRLKFKKSHT